MPDEKSLLDEFAEWWGVEDAVPKVETPKVETPKVEPKEKETPTLKKGKRVRTFFLEEDDDTPEPEPKKKKKDDPEPKGE